jgi:hypothetical protein
VIFVQLLNVESCPSRPINSPTKPGGACFDLVGDESVGKSVDQIDFVSRAVAIETEVASPAAVVAVLQCLHDDEVLEQRTSQRVRVS